MAIGQTQTQSGLATMMGQMPVRNQLVTQQQKAARALQLQQAVAGLPAQQAPVTRQQVGTIAGQMGEAAGQAQVGQAKEAIEMAGQAARLGQQETALAGQQRLAQMGTLAQQEAMDQTSRLAKIDQAAKKEIFDDTLQFKKDEADRTLYNERQLMDYAIMSANREEAFRNWEQKAKQYSERNLRMLEVAAAKVEQALRTGATENKQKLDQQQKLQLAQIQRDIQNRIAKAKAKAENIKMMAGAASGIMTAAGTALLATPAAPVGVGLMAAAPAVAGAGNVYAEQQGREQAGV